MEACETIARSDTDGFRVQGRVLKGQYTGVFRSSKGKLKGLLLRSSTGEHAVKLPKYLRPILVRELVPETFIQVWAYPDKDIWRAINVLPLPDAEIPSLQQELAELPQQQQTNIPGKANIPRKAKVLVQVCSKGKCFKQGGRHILQVLQTAVETNPELQHVSVEGTGCMKACKKGPNLRLPSGKIVSNLNPTNALAVLSEC